jgi:hypothetical protein
MKLAGAHNASDTIFCLVKSIRVAKVSPYSIFTQYEMTVPRAGFERMEFKSEDDLACGYYSQETVLSNFVKIAG